MKYLKLVYKSIMVALVAVVVGSCSDDKPAPAESRTVLVYMVADNNLSGWAARDLDEMREAVGRGLPAGQRWLVYYSGPDHRPRLIEYDREGNVNELAGYDNSTLSVTVERMRRVVEDAKRLAPADNYGLVLWSHGTGWLNDRGVVAQSTTQSVGNNQVDENSLSPQSFGYDGAAGGRMKISSLAAALEGHHFDFIYFDCCHMANVEVVYELRNVADRIVGCPTELGVEGMPYETNVALLLANRVTEAAAATFDYYAREFNRGDGYGCSIGVYSTDAIVDMAAAMRDIVNSDCRMPDDYYRVPYYRTSIMRSGIYDLNDYVAALNPEASLKTAFAEARDRLIEYFATTSAVYGLDANAFSGLAGNIVAYSVDITTYDYPDLAWYDAVWRDAVALQ